MLLSMHLASNRGVDMAVRNSMVMGISAACSAVMEGKYSAGNILQSASRLVHAYPGNNLSIIVGQESPDLAYYRNTLWSLQHVTRDQPLVPNIWLYNETSQTMLQLFRNRADEGVYWSLSRKFENGLMYLDTYALDEATGKPDYSEPVGNSTAIVYRMPALPRARTAALNELVWTDGPRSRDSWRAFIKGPRLSGDRIVYVLTPLIRDGKFEGVLGSGLRLHDVGKMLRESLLEEGAAVFLFEHEGPTAGRMIASSHGDLEVLNATALDWDNPEVVFVGRCLLREFGAWDRIPQSISRLYSMPSSGGGEGKLLFVQTRDVGIRGPGMHWMAVMFLDEGPYRASSARSLATSIGDLEHAIEELQQHFTRRNWWGVGALCLQVALLLALWYMLHSFLVKPMSLLSAQMKAMQRLQPPARRGHSSFSRFKEVRHMEATFESLAVVLTAFGKFVPKVVVKRIMAGEEQAMQLYVFPVVVTIMFTDIANFTTISEKVSLHKLMRVMEEYLSEMSAAIEASGGVIGDFIGDGIMAFWNSPTAVPNHELKAVETMEDQMSRLITLNEQWSADGFPSVWPRYGIHVGKVYSGNIGSQEKMKFGIVGDPVNLAARLESLCKHFGVKNLVSKEIYDPVSSAFLGFPHGKVAVKGKVLPVAIYEILCRRADAPDGLLRMCLEMEACIRHIDIKEYEPALASIQAVVQLQLELWGEVRESTTKYEATLCRCCLDPVGDEWDGVERMDSK
eukprot:jgi/Mesvir1/3800/Mv02826-RA.1